MSRSRLFLPLGKPAPGPVHPDYVPSVFSYSVKPRAPTSRYLRAEKRSKASVLNNHRENRSNEMDGGENRSNEMDGGENRSNEMDGGENRSNEMDGGENRSNEMDGGENRSNEMGGGENRSNEMGGGENRSNEMNDGLNGEEDGLNGEEDGLNGEEDGLNGEEDGLNGEEDGLNGEEDGLNGEEDGLNGEEDGLNGEEDGLNGEDYGLNGEEDGLNGEEVNGESDGANGDTVGELTNQLEFKEVEIGELQIENELLLQENENLKEENRQMKNRISQLTHLHGISSQSALTAHQQLRGLVLRETQLPPTEFNAQSLMDDDDKVCFYTGLPSYKVFKGLYLLLEPLLKKDYNKSSISLLDELLMVLMKLRLGVPNEDLGYRFKINPSRVSIIFHKWILIMSIELKCLVHWPDSLTLHENLPSCFRKHFSKVVCIIDCFEIFIERPVALHARAATYSNYKKHNTVKVLIAITPTGSISFISKAWGGRVSDKEITQKCGFLDKIQYDDDVMADRSFNIADDLAVCGARLLMPAFTRGKNQLSQVEVERSRRLARVRIHVERVIGQLRKKYTILRNTLPVSLIKCPSDSDKTNCTIDRILTVTAALTNLPPSVVPL